MKVPSRRKKDTDGHVLTRADLIGRLLPAVPDRYRALVALAGGTGLRWGECTELRWESLDLTTKTVEVVRVAVEVAGTVTIEPYPKSRADRRTVPVPDFAVDLLAAHPVFDHLAYAVDRAPSSTAKTKRSILTVTSPPGLRHLPDGRLEGALICTLSLPDGAVDQG
ncbi:tyrosine-type recombinase/integrase [Micromonospora sp. NPDC047738]|uniref:tyrosine-type recombinase/integrase n=1 Tax=Micromonospora sp. NPDC047738 TaxID=3155741 RepID=UPI0033F4EA41